MVTSVNHKQFKALLKVYYKQKTKDGRKIPLIAYGKFGLGKSAIIREAAEEIAKKNGRKYVEWNKLTRTEKEDVIANPKKYFVLIDIRLSEYDAGDFRLPDLRKEDDTFEWKSPYWAKLVEHIDSDGFIFFDELNLATQLVISSVYKIFYDRIINDGKINDSWLILGAGNTESDRAYIHELAAPVRDRAGEVELVAPSVDAWTDWAIANQINPVVIAYVNAQGSDLHKVDYESGQKFTTERGWERLSSLIENIDEMPVLELVCKTAIGEAIAIKFMSFYKIKDKVKIQEIIENPSKLIDYNNTENVDIIYFVTTSLSEQYKNAKIDFGKILEISSVLDKLKPEYVILLWKLCARYDAKRFSTDFMKDKWLTHPIRTKYFPLM